MARLDVPDANAYEQFERVARLDPNYADAQLHLAIMLAMKGTTTRPVRDIEGHWRSTRT